MIVSGDKDFYQLIAPGVALLNPGRGGPAGVEETWVDEIQRLRAARRDPSQVVDYLALVGDSSDNIPGVKGVGREGSAEAARRVWQPRDDPVRAGEVTAKRTREALLAGSRERAAVAASW